VLCRKTGVKVHEGVVIAELLTHEDSRVVGAVGFDVELGQMVRYRAAGTVLATAGADALPED
jgi:succinate dehydrogenase/fumarate reductase flavoprotein subunit